MIAATLSGAEAERGRWQMVVIGAGPAGSAVAIRLARSGLRVLLVDRDAMPRPKLCGCCLSPLALEQLRDLGVLDPAGRLADGTAPVRLDKVRVAAGGRSASLPMPGNACLSREALDAAVVRTAIEAGAHWLPGVAVSAIEQLSGGVSIVGCVAGGGGVAGREGGRIVLTADRGIIAAGLADHVRIVAREATAPQQRTETQRSETNGHGQPRAERRDGRQAAPRSRIGLGAVLAPDAIDRAALPAGMLVMAVADGGYCGLVRLEDGRIDLAAAVDRGWLAEAGSPAAAVASILRQSLGHEAGEDYPDGLLADAVFRATPPLTHHTPPVAGAEANVFRVGDAAGYVEPFTGEGIGWALAAAESLARAVAAGDAPAVAERYRTDLARRFAADHKRCLRVVRALRRPLIVAGGVRLAAMLPWAASRVVPLVLGVGRRATPAAR